MDKAKEIKRPIVLITNDNKSDWCVKLNKRKIYPQPELINEIYNYAGVKFHILNTSGFMDWANASFSLNINSQVEEIRKIDAQNKFGNVTGRVMARKDGLFKGKDTGFGGAYVSIIDININKEVSNTTTDAMGYYQFNNVKSSNGQISYQMYTKLDPFGEGRTDNFSLNANENKRINVYINVNPRALGFIVSEG